VFPCNWLSPRGNRRQSCRETTRSGALAGSEGTSQRNRAVARPAPASCAQMNPPTSPSLIRANVFVNPRGDRHRGVGERSRGGEPIGADDIGADRERHHLSAAPRAAPNHRQQSERRDALAEELRNPARTCADGVYSGRPNIRCATATPATTTVALADREGELYVSVDTDRSWWRRAGGSHPDQCPHVPRARSGIAAVRTIACRTSPVTARRLLRRSAWCSQHKTVRAVVC